MDVDIEQEGAVTTVGITGRFDGQTAREVEQRVFQVIEAGNHRLVLDLAGLDYISSVGLRVLILVAKRLKEVEGRLALCNLQASIQQVFEFAGFTTIFSIYPDREQALAAIR